MASVAPLRLVFKTRDDAAAGLYMGWLGAPTAHALHTALAERRDAQLSDWQQLVSWCRRVRRGTMNSLSSRDDAPSGSPLTAACAAAGLTIDQLERAMRLVDLTDAISENLMDAPLGALEPQAAEKAAVSVLREYARAARRAGLINHVPIDKLIALVPAAARDACAQPDTSGSCTVRAVLDGVVSAVTAEAEAEAQARAAEAAARGTPDEHTADAPGVDSAAAECATPVGAACHESGPRAAGVKDGTRPDERTPSGRAESAAPPSKRGHAVSATCDADDADSPEQPLPGMPPPPAPDGPGGVYSPSELVPERALGGGRPAQPAAHEPISELLDDVVPPAPKLSASHAPQSKRAAAAAGGARDATSKANADAKSRRKMKGKGLGAPLQEQGQQRNLLHMLQTMRSAAPPPG